MEWRFLQRRAVRDERECPSSSLVSLFFGAGHIIAWDVCAHVKVRRAKRGNMEREARATRRK